MKRLLVFFCVIAASLLKSQVVAATNTWTTNCYSCVPVSWSIVSGTPDKSNITTASLNTNGNVGGGAFWIANEGGVGTPITLPTPPNGHTHWLSLRDLGTINTVQEAASTNITGLTAGRSYEIFFYTLSAVTDQTGNSSSAYAGKFIDQFTVQLGAGSGQAYNTTQNTWQSQRLRFTASAASETITFRGGNNATTPGTTNPPKYLGAETVQISVTANAVNTIPIVIADFGQTTQNIPVSINVIANDSDPNGSIAANTVDLNPATPGIDNSLATAQGNWSVNSAGLVTFVPAAAFAGNATITYTVQDNYILNGLNLASTSQPANITVTVNSDFDKDGIPDYLDADDDNDGILDIDECSTTVGLANFSTSDNAPYSFNIPGADLGFIFDIYTLDNSFNLTVNGTNIANQEIQFLSTGPDNIRFADGDRYGINGIPNIWQITGSSSTNPAVKMFINVNGGVSMLGSKFSGGPLHPMVLTGGAAFNTITWNSQGNNTVSISQIINGTTYITGRGSGYKLGSCDPDGDGISNQLDFDSDGDGCFDAIEGDENLAAGQLNSNGSINIAATGINSQGVPALVNTGSPVDIGGDIGQGIGSSQNSAVNSCYCYKKPVTNAAAILPTKMGITALNRAGSATTEWPGVRNSGWLVLEAKTKGLVINRNAFADSDNDPATPTTPNGVPAANFVEGMILYDTVANCLKIFNGTAWNCYTTQACPD